MTAPKLVLVDGYSLIFRAFYALPLLTTKAGQPTNAVYGFVRMLLRLLKDLEPEYLAVALDTGRPTFRHARYPEYKANRAAAPDELKSQFPLVEELLESLRVPQLRVPGFEADDLLGAAARRFAGRALEVLLVSGDLDVLQVVGEHVRVLLTRRGMSEFEEYDPDAFRNRFGFDPVLLPDYKGLRGDPSDNIPGVRGIGDKTAKDLVRRYGPLENMLANLDSLEPKRARQALAAEADSALLGKELTTLTSDAPLTVTVADCRLNLPPREQLRELFSRYEFATLVREYADASVSAVTVDVADDEQSVVTALVRAQEANLAAVVFNPGDTGSPPRGVAVAWAPDHACYIPCESEAPTGETILPGLSSRRPAREALTAFLTGDTPKVTHDLKEGLWAAWALGGTLEHVTGDVLLASYLLHPERQAHPVTEIAREYLHSDLPALPPAKPKRGHPSPTPRQIAERYGRYAAAVLELHPVLETHLAERDQTELYRDLELPLAPVLFQMEQTGVLVDPDRLRSLAETLGTAIRELEQTIHRLAGEPFNIGSTKQLQRILFEKLGLEHGKRTKTGYSTSAAVLEKLAADHEIVRKILEYRELTKLKSTYVDGLLTAVHADTGRIHTRFNQTGTATGRLSSSEPNLQNIPIRTETGREIRAAFVAPPGDWVLLCADYSQVELRILAHITGDARLTEAFANDQDIHTRTAAQLFSVAPEEVTADMRRQAKVVNFGIAYGMSSQGLARDLGISEPEAKQYILNYFATYPGVQDYMRETVRRAREDGYVTTLLRRRRYLPDLVNPNTRVREFAERTAINTPIQGSAADLIKVAMIRVADELTRQGFSARLTLQVHDELVLECPVAELPAVAEMVVRVMTTAVPLRVPLKVDVEYGPNWKDLTPWEPGGQV